MNEQQIVLYAAIVLAVWQIITIVVRLTPTPRDDEIVSWLWRFLSIVIQGSRIRNAELNKTLDLAQKIALNDLNATMTANGKENLFKAVVENATKRCVSLVDGASNNLPDNFSNPAVYLLRSKLRSAVAGRNMKTKLGRALQRQIGMKL
jgi:hypothetical protein